ncbi:tetratricopeptide repeat protein [Geothermobacter hydrogeniphilus]|uniref:Uncharacterized protein n=1 Tax=Geothermobacter hydrogeniphilus TaxID=1969733 RepID=A0A1X0YEB7_9BACT|nr:tetratricopeptide repeat protein [Geothermobacter hydrogeniphilus]ORJ63530.1 hypothetical protein B5V00_01295 [Geothermobacter hydrogeniphilus]
MRSLSRRHTYVSFFLLLIIIGLLQTSPAAAGEGKKSVLNDLSSRSDMGISRVTFDFDRLPNYDLKTSGQRIDLILKHSAAGIGLKHLPEDDKIIKVLVARDLDNLIVSLLLRRIPSHVVATPDDNLHQLKLAIRWDDADTVRPGIVFDLPDMPAVRKNGVQLKRTSLARSHYKGNWTAFLQRSHTPIRLQVRPAYSLPDHAELPDDGLRGKYPEQWRIALRKADWQELQKLTAGAPTTAGKLLRGEALLRGGQPEQALQVLREIKLSDPRGVPQDRLHYFLAHAQVRTGQPYAALLSLTQPGDNTGRNTSWQPWIALLRAEVELGLGHADKALKALAAISPGDNEKLRLIKELRHADSLSLKGDYPAAMKAYLSLPEELTAERGFSLAQQALCCQMTENYGRAREVFNALAHLLPAGEDRALARYGELTCYEKQSRSLVYLDKLESLRWDNDGSEVAYRVMMKLSDLMAPGKTDAAIRRQLKDYRLVAEKAPIMDLRQEAGIKIAILQHLQGNNESAIHQLEKNLRDFKRGSLRNEAVSLLGELLPPTITDQIRKGRNLDALVLVERDRSLLIQQPLSWDFLYQIALAYDRLELDSRADKIFLYLYDRAKDRKQKARACLLLARNYLQLGELDLVEQYSERYRTLQPRGSDLARSWLLQLRARVARDGTKNAVAWFDRQKVTADSELALYAAQLYWELKRYDRVVENLDRAKKETTRLPLQAALWRAEAYYRLGRKEKALKYFQDLFNQPEAAAQARYRAATILLDKNKLEAGSQLLKEVAADTRDKRWSRLAADRLLSLTM